MNDLGYGQLLNPNRSLKLVLMRVEIIENSFDISTTLANDFIASYSLSQSPQIPSVDDEAFYAVVKTHKCRSNKIYNTELTMTKI